MGNRRVLEADYTSFPQPAFPMPNGAYAPFVPGNNRSRGEAYKQAQAAWDAEEGLTLDTRTIEGVEILRVGKWNGREYTHNMLQDMVDAFNELKLVYEPPGKLGHDKDQDLLQSDGYPAAGWVSSLKKASDRLIADFKDVPAKLAELIDAGAYKKRSSEVWFNMTFQGNTYPTVLKAVSWLGADAPAVSGMSDIFDMYTDPGGNAVAVVLMDSSHYEQRQMVHKALEERYPYPEYDEETYREILPEGARMSDPSCYIAEMYDEYVVVHSYDYTYLYRVDYTIDDDMSVSLGEPQQVVVQYEAVPSTDSNSEEEPSGESYSLREGLDDLLAQARLEYRDQPGLADLARHFRGVGPILDQLEPLPKPSVLTDDTDETDDDTEETVKDEEIREILGLEEGADIKTALIERQAQHVDPSEHEQLTHKVDELTTRLAAKDARELVDEALKEGKLVKVQEEWALSYAEHDLEGFKTYLESAQPVVELGDDSESGEDGTETEEAELENEQNAPSAEELEIADKMGIDPERLSDDRPMSVKLAERQEAEAAS